MAGEHTPMPREYWKGVREFWEANDREETRTVPMKLTPATVTLDEAALKEIVAAAVSAHGYVAGAVTFLCHPAQYNGPDTFSATVEVETPEARAARAKQSADEARARYEK